MIRPERRTRADVSAAVAIALAVALVIAGFWWRSSARATTFRAADAPAPIIAAAAAVPDALHQQWSAPSARTSSPIVIGATVVTGDDRTMTGLDAQTGQQRWSYSRDRDLCGVSAVYDLAVAVYPDSRGCGQVSGVKAASGQRGPTRTSYADDVVVLTSDGNAVLSTGPTRLELWRSDLVRMVSYGELDAPVKPVNTKLGTGCTLMSAAASESAVGVLEACRDEKDLRLTLLKPAKEEDEPDTKRVPLLGVAVDAEARVLAVAGTTTAVYLPIPRPEVEVYDDTGTKVSETPVVGAPEFRGPTPAIAHGGDVITWWTGNAVMVFDNKLNYRFTVTGEGPMAPNGPATMMAGRLLVPVAEGLAVLNPTDGERERVIALTHPTGTGPVFPAVVGQLVIEQRDATVAGYTP